VGVLTGSDSVVDKWGVVSHVVTSVNQDRAGWGSGSKGEEGKTDESLHICYLRGAE